MPRLWNQTIDAHRREVRDAVLDTTATLVGEYGLLGVTMSRIAEVTGIGRATLYKYFPDVEAILAAWHDRQIAGHLESLAEVRDQARGARRRLEAVLESYALMLHDSHGHDDAEVAALLHRGPHVARREKDLAAMIGELVSAAAAEGEVREDVAPDELGTYCLHALSAARNLPSKAAVRRLVTVTLAGLHPPP